MKNILFLGAKPIGEKAFHHLLHNLDKKQYYIRCVSSNQYKESSWWGTNKIYLTAQDLNLDFVPMEKRNFNSLKEKIAQYQIDMILAVGYNWILPESVLKMVNYKAINLHNAKLPDYKGYNASNMCILNEEKFYTSTLHWMAEEVDSGSLILEREFRIPKNIVAKDLYQIAQDNAVELVKDFIKILNGPEEILSKTLEGEGCFYPRNTINKKEIVSGDTLQGMALKARAFHFPNFEPAYFVVDEEKYFVIPAKGK